MTIFFTVLHVMVCLVLIVVVLLQHGKGADIGAVFGGGASTTVFGSRGAGNFLTKLTTAAALLFMVTSLGLAYLANTGGAGDLFEDQPATQTPVPEAAAPAAEEPAAGGFEEVQPAVPAEPQAAAPAAPEAAVAPQPAAPTEPAPATPDAAPATP